MEDFAKNRKLDFDYTYWLDLAINDLVAQAMNPQEKRKIDIFANFFKFFNRRSIALESDFQLNFRPTDEQMEVWGKKWKKELVS